MRVLGIPGSLRRDSYNRRLLAEVAELLPDGVSFGVFDALKEVPPYDEDDERGPVPAAVARLRAALAGADALLVATPEYNGSVPGQLKNAVDWASRPPATAALRNKPAAVVGATTGLFGAVWAQAELRKVLRTAGARVVEGELPVALAAQRGERLLDDELRARAEELVAELLDLVREPARAAA